MTSYTTAHYKFFHYKENIFGKLIYIEHTFRFVSEVVSWVGLQPSNPYYAKLSFLTKD